MKILWVHFVLAVYCWAWGLVLRVGCLPSEILFGKSKFSFVTSQGWGLVSTSSSMSGPHYANPDLCRSCACCHTLRVHIYLVVLFLEGLVSFTSSTPSDSYSLSIFPSLGFSEPWGEGVSGDTFRTECSKVFYSVFTLWCPVVCLFPSVTKWTVSDDDWVRPWSMSVVECP